MSEATASAEICARLRAVAVQQANPGWLAPLPAPLLAQMRASALGTRLIARTLAEGPAPALFGEPYWRMPPDADWLLRPPAALDELALDLAALALSALIRATVKRETVLRLKRVLGDARYALALNETSENLDSLGFAKALAADPALRRHLLAQGHAELVAFAATIHPACAERIRLTLAPTELPAVQPRLACARVRMHLDPLRVAAETAAPEPEQVANG